MSTTWRDGAERDGRRNWLRIRVAVRPRNGIPKRNAGGVGVGKRQNRVHGAFEIASKYVPGNDKPPGAVVTRYVHGLHRRAYRLPGTTRVRSRTVQRARQSCSPCAFRFFFHVHFRREKIPHPCRQAVKTFTRGLRT